MSTKTDYIDIKLAVHCNYDMQKIWKKEILEEADKYALVNAMKRIQNLCDYRVPELFTLAKQEEYLNKLSSEQLEKIYEQIEMYKKARILYKDYH